MEISKKYDDLLNKTYEQPGFVPKLGITITDMRPGYCVGEMPVDESLNNPHGNIHGGVMFTLADTIGGNAALAHGKRVVTLSSTINYLRPACNTTKLWAKATEVKLGSTIGVYDVYVYNDKDELLTTCSMTFFILDEKA